MPPRRGLAGGHASGLGSWVAAVPCAEASAQASFGAAPSSALLGYSRPLLSPGGQHGGSRGSRLEPHGSTFATN